MRTFSQNMVAAVKITGNKFPVEDVPEYPSAQTVGIIRAHQAVAPNEGQREDDQNRDYDIAPALSTMQLFFLREPDMLFPPVLPTVRPSGNRNRIR